MMRRYMAEHRIVPPELPARGWRCPPESELAAYLDGHGSARERQAIEAHIASCEFCVGAVADTVRAASGALAATPPALRRKAEALAQPPLRSWGWAWAVAPGVACLLIVIALVGRPHRASPPASEPAVARLASPPPASQQRVPDQERGLAPTSTIRILSPERGATLAREALRLRWEPVPHAVSYRVRLATLEGELLWEGRSERPQVEVPSTARIPQGSYYVWVVADLGDGHTVESAPLGFRVASRP